MTRTKVDNKLNVVVGTKAQILNDATIPENSFIIATDESSDLDLKVDKNDAITAGTKTKITYDSKGLVTSGADLEESDIPPLSVSKITQTSTAMFVTDTEKETWNEKQNTLTASDGISISDNVISATGDGGEIDLDEIGYLNYTAKIFYDSRKSDRFKNAWEDMKEVDGAEIERDSTPGTQYGTLQYPNGEDNGVIIPDNVTSIGDFAFYGWESNNQPLIIPDSVTSIGGSAFGGLYNYGSRNAPIIANSDVFADKYDAPIYVPDTSVTAYKNATNWFWLSSRIKPVSELNA